MKAKAVLRGTLRLLERDGWCQFSSKDPQGRRCLLRALRETRGPGGRAAESLLHGVIERKSDFGIVKWNDAEGRSFDDVRSALLAAIVKADSARHFRALERALGIPRGELRRAVNVVERAGVPWLNLSKEELIHLARTRVSGLGQMRAQHLAAASQRILDLTTRLHRLRALRVVHEDFDATTRAVCTFLGISCKKT